jgi:hypothetical protein
LPNRYTPSDWENKKKAKFDEEIHMEEKDKEEEEIDDKEEIHMEEDEEDEVDEDEDEEEVMPARRATAA